MTDSLAFEQAVPAGRRLAIARLTQPNVDFSAFGVSRRTMIRLTDRGSAP